METKRCRLLNVTVGEPKLKNRIGRDGEKLKRIDRNLEGKFLSLSC